MYSEKHPILLSHTTHYSSKNKAFFINVTILSRIVMILF
jgi:hypothetical protein